MGREPGGARAEKHACDKRDGKGEKKNEGGGAGLDRQVGCVGKGEGENGARSGVGDGESGKSADATEDDALSKNLADNARATSAEGHADGNVGAARGGAGQHEVGDVGTGNEQNDRGKDHQHRQAFAGLLLQVLDAATTRREHDMHLGNDGGAAVGGELRAGIEPLTKRSGKLGLQRDYVGSGADSANRVEPMGFRMIDDGAGSAKIGLSLDGHPEIGRRIRNPVAEESWGRDANDREGQSLNKDG